MNKNRNVSWMEGTTIPRTAMLFCTVSIGWIVWITFGNESPEMVRKLQGGLIAFFMMIGSILIALRKTIVSVFRGFIRKSTVPLMPGEKGVLLFLGTEVVLLVAIIVLLDWNHPIRYIARVSIILFAAIFSPFIHWFARKMGEWIGCE